MTVQDQGFDTQTPDAFEVLDENTIAYAWSCGRCGRWIRRTGGRSPLPTLMLYACPCGRMVRVRVPSDSGRLMDMRGFRE